MAERSMEAQLRVVTLDEFVAVEEPGADALLGDEESALIPEGGDVMFYGDGGAGKTTLAVDLVCHLAAGDAWLGIPVARPVKVLIVENEGPRPQFRKKLRRKRDGWAGSPLEGRLVVLEEPWSSLTLAKESDRVMLADTIATLAVDVVVLGPVTRSGMNEAGTLQEVRDFMALAADVRVRAGRPVVFVLIHHEAKGGKVSGAWEGAADTLLHVQAEGHGQTGLYVQKARWSSAHHRARLTLAWADGESFERIDEPDRDDNTVADEILAAVMANGGASWNKIDPLVTAQAERKRMIRDRLIASGQLANHGKIRRDGRPDFKLWHADDPACPTLPEQLRPDRDAPGTHPTSAPGVRGTGGASPSPAPPKGVGAGRTPTGPPSNDDERDTLPLGFDLAADLLHDNTSKTRKETTP